MLTLIVIMILVVLILLVSIVGMIFAEIISLLPSCIAVLVLAWAIYHFVIKKYMKKK